MRILTVITYYSPYISGLTIYSQRLAVALAKLGHSVTVLCMKHNSKLPEKEVLDEVTVERVSPLMPLSKGFLAPNFFWRIWKLAGNCDVVHIHLPQFEGGLAAIIAKLRKKKVIITYHCDLLLPPTLANYFIQKIVWFMNSVAAGLADCIVTYTEDFATHSKFLKKYRNKCQAIYPPVILANCSEDERAQIRRIADLENSSPVIGMATRMAAEKGVEVLLAALKQVKEKFPKVKVLFAGEWENVVGEREYKERILDKLNPLLLDNSWQFLGPLSPSQMSAFYKNINLLVVPSTNSTEAFGLVQIEAMMCGVPVIASNLPGVRQPVQITGMGSIFPVGDSLALADNIIRVLESPTTAIISKQNLQLFSPNLVGEQYINILKRP